MSIDYRTININIYIFSSQQNSKADFYLALFKYKNEKKSVDIIDLQLYRSINILQFFFQRTSITGRTKTY